MILGTSALVLPEATPLRRAMRRPAEFRQPGYEDAYDSRTLFYDVFRHGDEVVLSGPPLFNLRQPLAAARFTAGATALVASLGDIDRTQRSFLRGPAGEAVALVADGLNATLPISADGRELFQGRRVLTAISRNNRLEWIADWVTYYAAIHEVDAILLYDNGSDAYALAELDAAIGAGPGIEVAVVVNWPFPFGPRAGPDGAWDSDFCHASMHEHARFRFLETAAQVINADIDELIVTADGRPLHQHLAAARSGGLKYAGRWIEGVAGDRTPRFVDFDRYDPTRARCPPKWTIVPAAVPLAAQWSTHHFVGWSLQPAMGVRYGHFRLITTNWKYDRTKKRNSDNWVVDQVLRRDLNRAFP